MAQASINLGHFPSCFKTTTTIIMRKPQKPNYTKPNAYRPIALESTLGKVLESIITELLSYITESHNLIPWQHFGGRPGRTGEEAMTILSERIYRAWKEGEIILSCIHGRGWCIQLCTSPKAYTQHENKKGT